MNLEKIASFFEGWEETMIWSCLQGCMGEISPDDLENPKAAMLTLGDFCFFGGEPSETLVKQAAVFILVPQNQDWAQAIESVWQDGVTKGVRYAIQKEPDIFNLEKLSQYAHSFDGAYSVQLFDREIYEAALAESWSKDLCSLFPNYEDFKSRGMGAAVLFQGQLVAGASSYSAYHGGIEIEIDTKPEFRRKGLATACGARLILECLARGLYPSWDAHDLRSVMLAEKLGYHRDKPYPVYFLKNKEN